MDRRTFLASSAAGTLGVLCGCGSAADAPTAPDASGPGGTNPNAPPSGVTIDGDVITIELARVPALAQVGGVLFLTTAATVVVRAAEDDYRAFTAICTHAGCQVSGVTGARLRCPCHGSEYDFTGVVRRGPAEAPLAAFGVTRDGDRLVVTRR